ncbi:MAG: hypothetical protein GWP27_01495 [Bacteroidetes bacterium]|nr:hypothetical protein [Bacteroidota bacterium]
MLWFRYWEFWMRSVVPIWFRKLYIHFEEDLPTDGPIIFACTHPNSALDYFFLPLILRNGVSVLVRGDIFRNPILNFIFRRIWMLPVFRFRDGYSSLKDNATSFGACYEEFDNHGHVLIFPEGASVQHKTVQPLQKGSARLALNYLEKHGGDKMYIVPMANNYSRYRQFRSTIATRFGKAIDVNEYRDLYRENENKAFQKLTSDIAVELKRHFIEVNNYSDDCLTEKALMALRLDRLEERSEFYIEDDTVFQSERALVEKLNDLGEDALSAEWKETAIRVGLDQRTDGILEHQYSKDVYWVQRAILAPIMLISFIPSLLPHYISQWLIDNKIKDIIFYTTIHIAGNLILYSFQTIILAIVFGSLFGWMGLLVPLTVYLISKIGGEVVDEFLFAHYNWKKVAYRDDFKMLNEEVKALIR